MTNNFLPIAFLENKFIPFSQANISIATHALHYGTAAFGGLRGKIDPQNPNQVLLFRLDKHAERLSQSGMFLGYDISPTFIQKAIVGFVERNKPIDDFYIRPLVYTSDLGITPRLHDVEKDFLIYGLYFGSYFADKGLRVCFSSWQRQSDSSMPLRGKLSGAYITSALAKTEAHARGYDEAIFLNASGKVCEASAMNLFIVKDDILITPDANQDILEGITRRSIIEIANNLGIKVIQRVVDKTELMTADEFFLCGTGAKLVKVSMIEQYKLSDTTPIFEKLVDEINSITNGQKPDYADWITRIFL